MTFYQRHDTPWAKAGHVITWNQTELYPTGHIDEKALHYDWGLPEHSLEGKRIPEYHHLADDDDPVCSLTLTETAQEYKVSNESFLLAFDRFRGHITGWTYNGIPLLHPSNTDAPLIDLDFWRPPTNNDMAGQTGEWKRFGLDMMTSRLVSFKFIGATIGETEDTKRGLTFEVRQEFAPPTLAWRLEATTSYNVIANLNADVPFALQIRTFVTPKGNHPRNLPRIGHNIQLSPAYNHVAWFGLGPGESYRDKLSSQRLGIWEKAIDDMRTNYEVPQENGNRVGTRWCTVSSQKLEKKKEEEEAGEDENDESDDEYEHVSSQPEIEADISPPKDNSETASTARTTARTTIPPLRATINGHSHEKLERPYNVGCHRHHLQFSTQQYDASTLEKAAHPCNLDEAGAKREGALWRLDAANAGVGTAACGPGVYERDQVECGTRHWTLQLDVLRS